MHDDDWVKTFFDIYTGNIFIDKYMLILIREWSIKNVNHGNVIALLSTDRKLDVGPFGPRRNCVQNIV